MYIVFILKLFFFKKKKNTYIYIYLGVNKSIKKKLK